jgi:hypothetical protein
MSHQRLLILPLSDGSIAGSWSAEVLHRLFNISPPDVPANEHTSVADFWAACADTTVTATVRPPVTMPANDAQWTIVRDQVGGSRGTALAGLIGRMLGKSPDLDDVDAIVVWGSLGTHREFASRAELDGRRVGITYVSPDTSHFTICHEVGHLLGFEHPYGLVSEDPAGQQESEYGSPHCIMGTARRTVGRAIPAWATNPTPPPATNLWSTGGPRLSGAERFARDLRHSLVFVPAHMPPWIKVHPDVPDGNHSLADHGGPGELPRAVAFRVDPGWLVVELRRPRADVAFEWDGGLGLTSGDRDTHEAAGLVVHYIGSLLKKDVTPEQIRDGTAWIHYRAVFQGTIPVPLAARDSLDVADANSRVTLRDFDAGAGTARFTIERFSGRPSTRIVMRANVVTDARPPVPAGRFEAASTGEHCTIGVFDGVWLDEGRSLSLEAHATGFRDPEFAWRIAGVQAGDWKAQTTPAQTESHLIALDVSLPTADQVFASRRETVSVQVTTAWSTLRIEVPPGHGRVHLPVEVFVREPGDAVHRASSRVRIDAETRRLDFGLDYDEARAECRNAMSAMFRRLYEIEPELFEGRVRLSEVAPGPEWGLAEVGRMREIFERTPRLGAELRRSKIGPTVLGQALSRRTRPR